MHRVVEDTLGQVGGDWVQVPAVPKVSYEPLGEVISHFCNSASPLFKGHPILLSLIY